MHNVDACFNEYVEDYTGGIDCVDERGFGELRVTRRYGPSVQRDVLGEFDITRIVVENNFGTEVEFIVKNYHLRDVVIMEQHFNNGIENTTVPIEKDDFERPYPQTGWPGK